VTDLESLNFEKDPVLGYLDMDSILAELNRHPFADWPVRRIMYDCPNPRLYQKSREILAGRFVPYLFSMLNVMEKYDIDMDMARIDFVTETMDQELAVVIADLADKRGLENRITNVLLGYCAGAKKIKKAFGFDGGNVGHDSMLGLGASVKIQADVLSLLGFKIRPRVPGSAHPLAHAPLKELP
jgi:hypothetical protein